MQNLIRIYKYIIGPVFVGFFGSLLLNTDFSIINKQQFILTWISFAIGWGIGESISAYIRQRKLRKEQLKIIDVVFLKNIVEFHLDDGKKVLVSLSAFPKLKKASKKSKESWRLIANGLGVHWNSTDDDVLLHDNLLNCPKSVKKEYGIKIVKKEKEKD